MATRTNNGGTLGHPTKQRRPYCEHVVIDFALEANAATDVFQVINVPANSIILDAGVEVLVVDSAGNSGTVALGDGTTVWVAAAAPTALGQMTNASVANIVKGVADTLDITVGTGAINAKLRVWAIICDLSDTETAQVLDWA